MKRTLALITLVFTAALAQADLVIEQKMESAMINGDMTIKLKGDKMRMDMAGGPVGAMSTVMNMTTGDVTQIIHSQKMVMKISSSQAKQMMQMVKKKESGETPKLQATGKMEKIGAYNTEIYTWTGSGMTQKLWVAKDFPNFAKFKDLVVKMSKSPIAGMAQGMTPDMSTLPGMVVKTEAEVSGQKIVTTLVSLKEQPLENAIFEAPKDYQEMAVPAIPGAH